MPHPTRKFGEMPPDKLVRVEVVLPAALADRLSALAKEYGSVLRSERRSARDTLLSELLEAYLTPFKRTVLMPRSRRAAAE